MEAILSAALFLAVVAAPSTILFCSRSKLLFLRRGKQTQKGLTEASDARASPRQEMQEPHRGKKEREAKSNEERYNLKASQKQAGGTSQAQRGRNPRKETIGRKGTGGGERRKAQERGPNHVRLEKRKRKAGRRERKVVLRKERKPLTGTRIWSPPRRPSVPSPHNSFHAAHSLLCSSQGPSGRQGTAL